MESKTYMIVDGKLAKVPLKYAKKIAEKDALVAYAARLQEFIESETQTPNHLAGDAATYQLKQTMEKIIRLNRQIPPCVQFV